MVSEISQAAKEPLRLEPKYVPSFACLADLLGWPAVMPAAAQAAAHAAATSCLSSGTPRPPLHAIASAFEALVLLQGELHSWQLLTV